MKQLATVSIAIVLVLFSMSTANAQKELILSITGEDVSTVVSRFNQSQTKYKVIVQNQKYRNWRFAINQFRFSQEMAASGSRERTIDIAFIDNNWLSGMIKERWLEDISGKIARPEDFVNGLADAATSSGKLYALPFTNKGQVLFYRRDLHEKYNLPLPRTLKELEQNALLLIKYEKLDHGMTIHYTAIHLDILPFLWSNGGGIIENGKVIINHRNNIETLTSLQALARKKVLPGPESFAELKESYSKAKNFFMQGRSAYIITWNNRISDFEKSPIAGKFGILPIPPLKNGQKSFSVIGSWYLGVNAFSKQKEGAVSFLNYFFRDKIQRDMAAESNSFIPAGKSVYIDSQLKINNPYLQDLESAMANMRHRLKHPKEPQISQVLENTIKEIVIEGKPVKSLLDIAQKRIESIFGK